MANLRAVRIGVVATVVSLVIAVALWMLPSVVGQYFLPSAGDVVQLLLEMDRAHAKGVGVKAADEAYDALEYLLPYVTEEQLLALEQQLPGVEAYKTPEPACRELYFIYKRIKMARQSDDKTRIDYLMQKCSDMALGIVTRHPMSLSARRVLGIYRGTMSQISPESREIAMDYLCHLVDDSPPSTASFSAAYALMEEADLKGDTDVLTKRSRDILRIYEQGGLKTALNDPYGDDEEKSRLLYFVSYACFILNMMEDAVTQADYVVQRYMPPEGATPESVVSAGFVRAMAKAQLHAKDAVRAASDYDEFLQLFPNDPNCAQALVNKGLILERAVKVADAKVCYKSVLDAFPEEKAARKAEERLKAIANVQ